MATSLRLLVACLLLPLAASAPATSTASAPRRRSSSAKKSKVAAPKILNIEACAISSPGLDTAPFTYEEVTPLQPDSVEVVVHACCLTASDVQQCRGDWGPCLMPLVPGREAIGVVAKVGTAVKGLERGDRVAVLLGTGLDSEADDDGADRSALDLLTTGAAARRLRVPARWAFELPLALQSAQAAGLLSTGGAVWAQLTQRRLPKGAKIGVLGGGASAALALSLAEAMGMEAYAVGVGPRPEGAAPAPATAAPTGDDEDDDEEDDDDDTSAGVSASAEYVDVSSGEDLRLHTGSFDALLVVSATATVDLAPLLPVMARGGSVLLAGSAAATLSLPPRELQDRRLSLLGPPPASRKATLAMLAFVAEGGVSWPYAEGELTAEGANTALASLAGVPEGRAVLMQPEEHAKWIKLSKKQKAKAKANGGAAAAAAAASAASMSSVFGVFSKVADATRGAANAMTSTISEQTAKLVEQVEKEEIEDRERREGALQLGVPAQATAEVEDDEEDEDEDAEGGDDDDEEEDDEDGDDVDEDDEDEDDEEDDDEEDDDDDEDEDDEDEDDDEEDDDDEDEEDDEDEDED